MIRTNKTLKKIDLKWNEIGRQGASYILAAVRENFIIQYVELTGNKGSEEVVKAMDTFLQRNRGEIGGLSQVHSAFPIATANGVQNQIIQKEKEYAEDLRAKYQAQVIANERTDKRVKELENVLEKERRKLKATNNDLVRSLEEEKIARKSLDSTLLKLKEEFARSELEKDKLIIDL